MGRLSKSRKLSLFLAILMASQDLFTQALAAAPVSLSEPLTGQALSEAKVELALDVADEMTAYLNRGKTDVSGLIAWLGRGEDWPKTSAQECRLNNYCLMMRRDIHIIHKRLRINMALSFSPTISGFDLGDLDVAGNPHMLAPVYSPLFGSYEKLTPSEHKIAQEELWNFWDGNGHTQDERDLHELLTGKKLPSDNPGVINEYIEILKAKVKDLKNSPWQLDKVKGYLEAFEKTRRISDRAQRVREAMLIGDEAWRSFRKSKLSQFRKEIVLEIWSMVDTFRPIVYLREARITPSNLRSALQASLVDTEKMNQKVDRARQLIIPFKGASAPYLLKTRPGGSDEPAKATEWLLDFSPVVFQVLKKNSRYQAAFVSMRRTIDNQNLAWDLAVTAALLAPIILIFPPAAVALGTLGGVGITAASLAAAGKLTYDAINRYRDLSLQYFAHWTPDELNNFLVNSEEFANSQRNAILSPAALTLYIGIPTTRTSRLHKLFTTPH